MGDSDKARGQTIPVQGEEQTRSPRQPHERDESASSQTAGEPSHGRMGSLAKNDLDAGRTDTTKQRELERTYDRLKDSTETRGDTDPEALKREG